MEGDESSRLCSPGTSRLLLPTQRPVIMPSSRRYTRLLALPPLPRSEDPTRDRTTTATPGASRPGSETRRPRSPARTTSSRGSWATTFARGTRGPPLRRPHPRVPGRRRQSISGSSVRTLHRGGRSRRRSPLPLLHSPARFAPRRRLPRRPRNRPRSRLRSGSDWRTSGSTRRRRPR